MQQAEATCHTNGAHCHGMLRVEVALMHLSELHTAVCTCVGVLNVYQCGMNSLP